VTRRKRKITTVDLDRVTRRVDLAITIRLASCWLSLQHGLMSDNENKRTTSNEKHEKDMWRHFVEAFREMLGADLSVLLDSISVDDDDDCDNDNDYNKDEDEEDILIFQTRTNDGGVLSTSTLKQ